MSSIKKYAALDDESFDKKLEKSEYKEKLGPLSDELAALQHRVKEAKIPVIIVIEGWGTAGKGRIISKLITTLDPRDYDVYSTKTSTEYDRSYPWLRRFWLELPQDGMFSIFDKSWYSALVLDHTNGYLDENDIKKRIEEINQFELMMTEHGAVILKFFLNISKDEQQKRFAKRLGDSSYSWRISNTDQLQIAHYDAFKKAYDRAFKATHAENAPWTIIPANDTRYAILSVFKETVARLTEALAAKEAASAVAPVYGLPTVAPYISPSVELKAVPSLAENDLSQSVSQKEYKKELDRLQKRLYTLSNELYRKQIPMIILYEGWDAAGKGGNIKRVAQSLEPYGFRVIPIAAPSTPDRERHFLYRFCRALPADGEIRIFDRTWYGRVMVEPIEKLISRSECENAYNDIVLFEQMLHRHGMIIKKFWINVDKDEQLRRFEARQNDPAKQWKITDEDWRNREKWDEYAAAIDYMIKYTSTSFAPWEIIASNDKLFARLATLRSIIKSIESRLEEE